MIRISQFDILKMQVSWRLTRVPPAEDLTSPDLGGHSEQDALNCS